MSSTKYYLEHEIVGGKRVTDKCVPVLDDIDTVTGVEKVLVKGAGGVGKEQVVTAGGLEWLSIETATSDTVVVDFDNPKAHKIPLGDIEDDIEIIIKNLHETLSKTMTIEIIGHSTNNYDVTWKYDDGGGAVAISTANLKKIFQDEVHLYKAYSGHRYFITITTMGDSITNTIISFIRI